MILKTVLGWALFHTIWEGALIALLLCVALWFLHSSRLRYAAACTALVATVAGFAITLVRLMPEPIAMLAGPGGRGIIAGAGGQPALPPLGPFENAMPQWIAPLWLLGVMLFQLRALGGWVWIRRVRSAGIGVPADHWQQRVKQLASDLGIGKGVELLQSSLAEVPVVTGHLRPVILMPLGLLTTMPREQIETILMHELAHIRRHDYLVNLAQTFAEGLLFYHPAVWWISNEIRTERENCCDDMVVAANGDPRQYALALTSLAENRWAGNGVALAASGGSLVKRIRRILSQPEGPRPTPMPLLAASLLAAMSGVALLAFQAKAPDRPSTEATSTPRMKWVNEDVAYIIRDDERQAFLTLRTDEEREKFIEQFWLRRDPTPGTAANEYKEEHYRRLKFVMDRFSVPSGLAGWKTDRGRTYILYGQPDEIDAHPSGDSKVSTYPFEDWRYKFIQGKGLDVIIEFVDSTMNGEYRMTTDPNARKP